LYVAAAKDGKGNAAVMAANCENAARPLKLNLEGEIVACKITDADRTCCQVELPETLPPYSFVIVTTKSRK
jgi:hypothetical protein